MFDSCLDNVFFSSQNKIKLNKQNFSAYTISQYLKNFF